MPTSDYHQISDVLHVIQQIDPRTVLDVGVGFGKWGILCREILEVYKERLSPDRWEVTIDGIEIHEAYRNPLWDVAYDSIHIGNAVDLLPTLGTYELIVCCDVIEHFDKQSGLQFIGQMLRHAPLVLLTSPRGFHPQEAACGNEHERHLSGWMEEDFAAMPYIYKDVGFTFMAIVAAEPGSLKHISVQSPLEILGVKKAARELSKMAIRQGKRRLGIGNKPEVA